LKGYSYENQRIVPVFYKGDNFGGLRPDIIVDNKIIIELKAVSRCLSLKEETQVRKYMEVLKLKKGVLINFPQSGTKDCAEEPEIKVVE